MQTEQREAKGIGGKNHARSMHAFSSDVKSHVATLRHIEVHNRRVLKNLSPGPLHDVRQSG
jgi:hypothetical protein